MEDLQYKFHRINGGMYSISLNGIHVSFVTSNGEDAIYQTDRLIKGTGATSRRDWVERYYKQMRGGVE